MDTKYNQSHYKKIVRRFLALDDTFSRLHEAAWTALVILGVGGLAMDHPGGVGDFVVAYCNTPNFKESDILAENATSQPLFDPPAS